MAHIPGSGGMFPGDANLSPTYSYGTFVENPSASDAPFYRPFAADSSEILFITGNGLYFGRGSYPAVMQAVNARLGDFGPNIDFTIALNGVVSTRQCNILSRTGVFEDPWISLTANHSPVELIIWGEYGEFGQTWATFPHATLKNNNGGLNVYVRR